MKQARGRNEYDAIVIGSGTCGATIAQALSRQKKKVLVLERGGHSPLKESLSGIMAIAEQVKLGDGRLSTVRGITTGGSTALYFGVVNYPPLDSFRALGIDLQAELETVKKELPIAQLPDELLSIQARRLRDGALALGHAWRKHDMLVDLSRCSSGYEYAAKWKARSFVDDAVHHGAKLVNHANVHKIIFDQRTAVGVEYKLKAGFGRHEIRQAFAAKIILAAGETVTPEILRRNGISDVGQRGFYCNPGYAMYGIVPGLQGRSGFVGSTGCVLDADIELADASLPQPLHKPMMLGGLKWRHLFNYPETVGIGVKVKDDLGGELRCNGRFYKQFSREDHLKLDKGKQAALQIFKRIGARHVVDFGIGAAGRVGGLVRIQEHVDSRLETAYRNLHVCDGSVIPDDMRGTPTVTLVCMARYLSGHLLAAL